MAQAQTLLELIAQGADDAEAIAAPERAPLTYGGLRRHVGDTVAALNRLGLGRADRVAMVLPNGPEMATAAIAVAAGATAAPLNPTYLGQEFAFYLADLDARALIVEAGSNSPAVEVARTQGIPVIELRPRPSGPAGLFDLCGEAAAGIAEGGFAGADEVALALHTSGTTSRPKMVPLKHRNLCTSAGNIRKALTLSETDRCLNIMPLFHIHGIMAPLVASL
jgi:acyl-CoA synthetase (AMP-forming)/AMP-acid ligase II